MPVNEQGVDLSKIVLPINAVEFTLAGITNTGNSPWVDISGLKDITLFLTAIETGGTVAVEVANGAASPAGHGAILATLSPDANHNASLVVANAWHWLRIVKTASASPTATVTNIYGCFN